MDVVLESIETWAPVVVGMTHAGFSMHYAGNFEKRDVRDGEWNGKSGHTVLGLSGASIAMQLAALIVWFRWFVKIRSGKIQMKGNNPGYAKGMDRLWMMLLLFYVMAMALAGMTTAVVTDFDGDKAAVVRDELKGDVGKHVYPLAATVLAVGASCIVYKRWLDNVVRDPKKKFQITETFNN